MKIQKSSILLSIFLSCNLQSGEYKKPDESHSKVIKLYFENQRVPIDIDLPTAKLSGTLKNMLEHDYEDEVCINDIPESIGSKIIELLKIKISNEDSYALLIRKINEYNLSTTQLIALLNGINFLNIPLLAIYLMDYIRSKSSSHTFLKEFIKQSLLDLPDQLTDKLLCLAPFSLVQTDDYIYYDRSAYLNEIIHELSKSEQEEVQEKLKRLKMFGFN